MIGPNSVPTRSVPVRWIEKSSTSSPIAIGMIQLEKPGAATAIPSTADRTDTAGVIIESP